MKGGSMPNSHFTKTYNKVVVAGDTLIDLSGDTVTAADLATGVTAHDKNGDQITGSAPAPADYVMETGSSGTHGNGATKSYYYQKWNSGKLEVWLSDYQSTANGSSYGNMYYRQVVITFANFSGLPAFVDVPWAQVTMRYTSNLLGCSIYGLSSTAVSCFMFGALQSITPYYDVYCVGRWK